MTNRNCFRTALVLSSMVALTIACASTPDSRIEKNQSLFDSYTEEIQSKLRSGRVDVGYDMEMVRMALGKPDETSTAIDETGETLMWGYTRSRPGFSVGLGGGSFGGSTGLGMGIGMGSGPKRNYTAIIEFHEGKVVRARVFD